jgi:glutathione S-transferase
VEGAWYDRAMKLYGTTTSPYVRRVRVVAREVGEPIDRVDTATEAGLAELRTVSPIRKVPVAIVEGGPLFDSRTIVEWLEVHRGWPAPRDPWREANLVNAIDAALDSVIQLFYLRRDGVAIDGTPFAERQLARADAIFAWLATQLAPDNKSFTGGFALPEISLVAALDWMDFRATYPTERAAGVEGVRAAWRDRPSLAETRPHA